MNGGHHSGALICQFPAIADGADQTSVNEYRTAAHALGHAAGAVN